MWIPAIQEVCIWLKGGDGIVLLTVQVEYNNLTFGAMQDDYLWAMQEDQMLVPASQGGFCADFAWPAPQGAVAGEGGRHTSCRIGSRSIRSSKLVSNYLQADRVGRILFVVMIVVMAMGGSC